MVVYTYDGLRVCVDDERRVVTTIWPDGTKLVAIPVDDPENRARAQTLGYDDPDPLWQMTRDHDLVHHLVARARGERWSDHLHRIAAGEPSPGGGDEEAIVLLVQRAAREGIHHLARAA